MSFRHAAAGSRRSTAAGLWEVIGNRMEPNRVSIRLFGDVLSTTPK
jgi:hypothetical protein